MWHDPAWWLVEASQTTHSWPFTSHPSHTKLHYLTITSYKWFSVWRVCVCVCVCVWLGLMCFRTKAIIIFIYNGNQASIIFTVIPSLLTLSPPFSNYITALLYQFLSFSPSFILSLILCDHSSALSVLYKPYNSIPTLTPLTLLFRRIGVKLGFIICQFNNK